MTEVADRPEPIVVRDRAGNVRAVVTIDEGSPVIGLFDPAGRAAGGVGFSPVDGDLTVVLADTQGRLRMGVKLMDHGVPVLFSYDQDGQPLSARPLEDPPLKRLDLAAGAN